MRGKLVVLIAAALGGCGTTYNTVRVPLHEGSQPLVTPTSAVEITDLRPEEERITHLGRRFSCQRWYGDETFQPSKLEYLKHLLAKQLPPGETLQLSVEQFDIIEFCEDTASQAAAAAATGASYGSGNPMVYVATRVPGGDRVEVHVAGKVGGTTPFRLSRQFDYSDLHTKFAQMPAANEEYRNRLRNALGEIATQIQLVASRDRIQ
jgi:hypothetical protein